MRVCLCAMVLMIGAVAGLGQDPSVASNGRDEALMVAQTWVGRALFVRGCYAASELRYDAAGRVQGTPKVVDWTLAGVDLQTVARKGADTIELDGVRVAIRFNRDNRLFERHAQKEAQVRLLIVLGKNGAGNGGAGSSGAGNGGVAAETLMNRIFAVGIDPALQRAMPEYWQHYFNPQRPWGPDGLQTERLYHPSDARAGLIVAPGAEHRTEAGFSAEAERDRVQGKVGIKLVVDSSGTPQRFAVTDPLGYGLDARVVDSVAKWRFTPGTLGGRPITAELELMEEFVLAPGRP